MKNISKYLRSTKDLLLVFRERLKLRVGGYIDGRIEGKRDGFVYIFLKFYNGTYID